MMQNDIILIGVTGGVGAGKSTVLNFMKEKYGVKILLLDEVGHESIAPGHPGYEKVLALFGNGIVKEDGTPNRARIADIIRDDPEKAVRLNAIVHPAVREMTDAWLRALKENAVKEPRRRRGPEIAVIESAILIESGYAEICDEVWYIYADAAVRRKRIAENRRWSDARIAATMRAQKSDSQFRCAADTVIDNTGTPADTRKQVEAEIERLLDRYR